MRHEEWIKEKTCPLSCLVKKKRELKMGRLEGLHLDEVEKLRRKGGFMREGDRTRRSETVEGRQTENCRKCY